MKYVAMCNDSVHADHDTGPDFDFDPNFWVHHSLLQRRRAGSFTVQKTRNLVFQFAGKVANISMKSGLGVAQGLLSWSGSTAFPSL